MVLDYLPLDTTRARSPLVSTGSRNTLDPLEIVGGTPGRLWSEENSTRQCRFLAGGTLSAAYSVDSCIGTPKSAGGT